MNKEQIAEQILKKHLDEKFGVLFLTQEGAIAAIIEAMGEKSEIPSNIEELAAKAIPNHPYPDMNYPGDAVTKISRKSWIEGYKEAIGVQSGMRWVKASEKPPHNKGVLVFIPEEDNHITSGMWDISNNWVLLDEYRPINNNAVTHWMPLPAPPDDTNKEDVASDRVEAMGVQPEKMCMSKLMSLIKAYNDEELSIGKFLEEINQTPTK